MTPMSMNLSINQVVNAIVAEKKEIVMSMKISRLIPVVLLSALLAACATTHAPAPVVSRTSQSAETPVAAATAPAAITEGRGYYRVKKGDTLFRIAVDVGQSYKDIVAWNNLTNPNDIKVDQMLRVQPPEAGALGPGGVQVGSVGGSPGVDVRPLATPAATTNLPPEASVNKIGPRGDKRPYSDAAMAELEKPDAASSTAPAPAVTSPSAPTPSVPTPSAKGDTAPAAPAAATAEDQAMEWMWPADGKVVGGFAAKKGIDIAGKSGQAVMAAGAGKVMYAGAGIRGYGNLVIIKHNNNLLSAYAHNKTILVKEGQQVGKGQKIAEMGNSDSDTVMLHFEIRQQGKPVDPSKYLPPK
jgi:lipoprotein NlpD